MTPFLTILTPLSYVPVLFGIFIGAWGCLGIILSKYAIDLATAVPMISGGEGNIAAPLLLAGVAAFGFIQGAVIRKRQSGELDVTRTQFGPLGCMEHSAVLALGFALLTGPFWLQTPLPEAWAAAIAIVMLMIWRKYCR